MAPIVRASGVMKSYHGDKVLHGVDLEVQKGEVVCIIGPSGSGKSTFLRCINHLERLDGGIVEVGGELIGYERHRGSLREMREKDIARQRLEIGMVFQSFNLFQHRTVLENLTDGPVRLKGEAVSEARRRASELLERIGLADRCAAYPAHLSGGQQQRVAIVRALMMRPALMLFDEPTSALDPELVADVLAVMKDLARTGMTMLVVTHEIAFAREVADKVVVMDQGRVIEQGPPGVVLSAPRHQRTQDFLQHLL